MRSNITVLNKLKKQDSNTGLDVWYVTKFKDIKYTKRKVTTVDGINVSMGEEFIVLFPFNDKYLQYSKWKNSDKDNAYTMSQGDIIVFDDYDIVEGTAVNIAKIKTKYTACEVRSVEEMENKYGAVNQLRCSGV